MSQDARRDEESATLRRARLLGLNYVDTSTLSQKMLYPDILAKDEMYKLRIIPLQSDKSNILFGITNTTSQQTINDYKRRFSDVRTSFAMISDAGYREYMQLYDPPKKVEYQDIDFGEDSGEELFERVTKTLGNVRADDILAYLVQQGYRLKASDIHLENQKDYVRIRFRVDGVLHPIETVPTVWGQDVVMRIFTLQLELLKLENLGLNERERSVVDDIITHPTGMVLVVGPTGSGKTTTLYSIVNTLNSPERKILTLEDPVEYFMEGIVQIPVRGDSNASGFAEKLRAVLRLDPDVVMVGEIRDQDTAKTALQAALTGHLVLSTFHASSAAAAVTRMLDFIGINPLFASAIHLIMAQRLVRLLDDKTKQPYKPDGPLLAQIQAVLDTLPANVPKPDISDLTLYKPGKSEENPFGYTGQTPLREQMLMTPGVQELLRLPPAQITTALLEKRAIEDGMITMLQDGILKVIAGKTTLEEVYRVVG